MLGVVFEVRVLPVVVPGEDVAGLVPGLGFAARRERKLQRVNDQQAGHSRSLPTTRMIGRGRNHFERGSGLARPTAVYDRNPRVTVSFRVEDKAVELAEDGCPPIGVAWW